jgi:hypothetical protein
MLHVTEQIMTRHETFDTKTRVARHRSAMRAQGYRLKQLWVPQVNARPFLEQARRDCATINAATSDDLNFAEAVQYWPPNVPD